jgi:hypothetical protein
MELHDIAALSFGTVLAATPKEKQRHNKKSKELACALGLCVQQYNVLVEEFNKALAAANATQPLHGSGLAPTTPFWGQARNTTSADDVRTQRFSWVNEYACKQAWHVSCGQ